MKYQRMTQVLLCTLLVMVFVFSPFSVNAATYPGNQAVADRIVKAINENDVDAFKSMFSSHFQSRMPDLAKQIQNMFSLIHRDGLIENYSFFDGGGSDGRDDNGNYHRKKTFGVKFTAGDNFYMLTGVWIVAQTDNPSMVGLSSCRLNSVDSEGRLKEYLYKIWLPTEVSLHYKDTYEVIHCLWDMKYLLRKMGYEKMTVLSSNESVATIDEDGILTATGRGTARVTVTYLNEETGKKWEYDYDVTVTFTTWQTIIWYFFFGFLWY